MRKTILSTLLFFIVFSLHADEGMWMLHLLKQQKHADMKKLGLKLDAYDIYNPDGSSLKDAVVQFGRGCTGEVISSQGLVLTNHHCGYGQIQNHSTLENNYLENGFWAMSKAEELPNPGLTVTFIDKIYDVTDYVKQCLKRDKAKDTEGVFFLSPAYLNSIGNEKMGAAFLKENPGMEIEVKPFFEGNKYYMFVKKVYSDVRLVGAPPSGVGKFGADTDNWMWPRHTGDFSLFRVYADKNGNPAAYSPKNVPLRPKRWLKISLRGVQENDFAMILGFPGTTHKFYTSWEVAERRDIDNHVRVKMREVRQNAMLEEMLKDPAVKIQYAAKYAGSTNGYKNAIGTDWAINMRDFEKGKHDRQEQLIRWAKKNGKPEYVDALDEIKQIIENRSKVRYRAWMLNEGIRRAIEFSRVPIKNRDSLIVAIENNDKESIVKFKEKLISDYHNFADKDYNRDVDKKVSRAMLKEYVRLIPRDEQPAYLNTIYTDFNGDVDAFVDFIFNRSIFGSEENLNAFLANTNAETLKNDPIFRFVQSISDEALKLSQLQQTYDRPFALARKKYVEGMLAMNGELTYFPDANLTLRLSYGQVKGYKPRDAVFYTHQTTMDGIMEKEDPDNWEFVVPEKLKTLYNNNDFGQYAMPDGKMPVDFAATTHTTGGNSGSPVMNGNGELIGINFDRNWEGVGGDIQYLPDYQRSIIVDIRYVLFIIDKYAEAKHLINEMELMK